MTPVMVITGFTIIHKFLHGAQKLSGIIQDAHGNTGICDLILENRPYCLSHLVFREIQI